MQGRRESENIDVIPINFVTYQSIREAFPNRCVLCIPRYLSFRCIQESFEDVDCNTVASGKVAGIDVGFEVFEEVVVIVQHGLNSGSWDFVAQGR